MSIECYKGDCKYHEPEEPFCMLNDCQCCPNCGELDCIPQGAIEKCKIDGSGIDVVSCVKCGVSLRIYLRRIVTTQLTCIQLFDSPKKIVPV